MAREITLLVISCFYGILLTIGPVFINWCNHFSYFTRPLTAIDVAMGATIIMGSGVAGIAIGDVFHPRIMGDRKIAVAVAIGIMILSVVKDSVIQKYEILTLAGIFLPSVMKPAHDLGNGNYFEAKSVFTYLIMMALYYLIIVVIKNLILNRKKF